MRLVRELTPTDLAYQLIEARIARLNQIKELADTDLFRQLANFAFGANEHSKPQIGDNEWQFHVYLSGLDSFKDPKLTDLLSNIFLLDPDEEKENDFASLHNKDYRFAWKFQDNLQIQFTIGAYVRQDSEGCKRVLVKTEMVERPIYRMDCSPDVELVEPAKLVAPLVEIENDIPF